MWIEEKNPIFDELKAEIISDKNAYGNMKVELGKPVHGRWWHYESNGEIISYVWLKEQADIQALYNQPGDETPEIGIAVRSKYQEAGYGFEAMSFIDEQAKKLGYTKIFAKTKMENPRAKEVIELAFMLGAYGVGPEGRVLNLEETLQYAKQVALLTLRKDLL